MLEITFEVALKALNLRYAMYHPLIHLTTIRIDVPLQLRKGCRFPVAFQQLREAESRWCAAFPVPQCEEHRTLL
jgi:hypothetical protein